MHKSELARRYTVFMLAMVIGSFGVTLVTRSLLGVNSVACFSYVTSVYFPITMGTVNILFNLTMFVSQFFILTGEQRHRELGNFLLQIPAMILFGVMLDVWLWITDSLVIVNYAMALTILFIGSVLIAVNIALQATASVAMLPCDAFVRQLATRLQKRLGSLKFIYDLFLVGTAAIMSLVCSGFTEIVGIREGTVIGALIVGPITQVALRFMLPFKLFCEGGLNRNESKESN
ncbi:MAG TPA: hypothetical protein IAB18_03630 [Candidatus Avisuccinivibrio pullicola]|nr:hypothetical protein [Candidatus Avisuccinivibrio pullicola]